MATFFGSTPRDNLDEIEISREELVSSVQDGQAALVVYNQMHCEIRNLQQQMVTLNNNMEELKSRSCEAKGGKGQKKLPKRLLDVVKKVYGQSSSSFNSAELFGSQHNQAVATELLEKIAEHYKKYDEKVIGRAIHRYYESRRRVHNDSQPHRRAAVAKNKEKAKRKGYRARLYRRRKNVATEREKIKWSEIDYRYMTSESDDENGIVRVHHLPWTSDELQNLKATLDQRLQDRAMVTGRYVAKPREQSTPSTLSMPPHPVKWAVNSMPQGSSTDVVIDSQCQVTPITMTNPTSSQQSVQRRQNITPLSVATNVLSSTTPNRYASQPSRRCHRQSAQHQNSVAGLNAFRRATQGGSSVQIGSGFHVAQGGSGLRGGGGLQGGLALFNNAGLHVRRNSTRVDSDQDRDPNSCNRYISPSELMNEFDESAAECFAQSNDSQSDDLQ